MKRKELDIIVPVYKNQEMTKLCIDSIFENWDEISDANPRLILIDDSPLDRQTSNYLENVAATSDRVILLANEKNAGFVVSTNRGLAIAARDGRDALLVNSDTVTFPGTLKELREVAYSDEMIAFACPRSNNASLSTFPHTAGGRVLTPQRAFELWQLLGRTLPRMHFIPTAVGFYLYVRSHVMGNVGGLREDFGKGYEEENDLVMRANKAGYRAVMANHSFAFHSGSASFALSGMDLTNQRESNLRRIQEIHPEFVPLVRRYESSAHFRAEKLLSGLKPDSSGRISIVFDLSAMGCNFNGTNELALGIIHGCAASLPAAFKLAVLCSPEAFEFHELDSIDRLTRVDSSSPGLHAIAVRLGQPFDLHHLNVLEGLAPVNVYGMLDTIAEDCGHLSISQRLHPMWRHTAKTANGLFFIGDYSRRSFLNRFEVASNCALFARLLPTKLASYDRRKGGGDEHVLVLGNHFPHKASDHVGAVIARKFPSVKVEILGGDEISVRNMTSHRSGTLSQEKVTSLFESASVVVLPSHDEGFGFGLMHALAAGKVVLARDLPATREILATFKSVSGVFLFESDAEIPHLLERAMALEHSAVDDANCEDWTGWGTEFMGFCERLLLSDALFTITERRIFDGDWLRAGWASSPSVVEHMPRMYFLPPLPLPVGSEQNVGAVHEERKLKLVEILALQDDTEFVRAMYLHILKRPGDADGIRHHTKLLSAGVERLDIAEQMAGSQEAKECGTSSLRLTEISQVRSTTH